MTGVTGPMIRAWIEKSADVLSDNRAYLTDLDSPIGDADHGNNMERGFNAARAALPDTDDIGAILKAVAMALISKVGGAAGPLYGTFFLDGSKVLAGETEADSTQLAEFFDQGTEGVKKRGRSDVGMKTMLDALVPAADALRAVEADGTLASALRAAAKAAGDGMTATIPMQAQRGRASYVGERSIGHQDPGATSSTLLIQALSDVVNEAQ